MIGRVFAWLSLLLLPALAFANSYRVDSVAIANLDNTDDIACGNAIPGQTYSSVSALQSALDACKIGIPSPVNQPGRIWCSTDADGATGVSAGGNFNFGIRGSSGGTCNYAYGEIIAYGVVVAPTCGHASGSDLGYVATDGTFNADGTQHVVHTSGTYCVDSCNAVVTPELTIVAHLGSGRASASGVTYSYISQGTYCASNTDTGGAGLNGFDCTHFDSSVGTTAQGCSNNTHSVGDAADLVVNGQDVGPSAADIPSVNQAGCQTLASGAIFCIASAPDSVKPDTGVPGNAASPDATVTTQNQSCPSGSATCTFDYFTPNTVAQSSNYGKNIGHDACPSGTQLASDGTCSPTGATGGTQCPSGQTMASGVCTGSGSGSGSGSGTGTCAPGTTGTYPDCTENTGTVTGAGFSGVASYAETDTAFWTAVSGSPLGTSLGGVAAAFPSGGTCPAPTFEVFGHTFAFDGFCTALDAYSGVIHSVMIAVYTISAIMLFFTA